MKIKSKLIYRRWTNLLSTTSFYLLSSSFGNISPNFHETYLIYFKTMVVVEHIYYLFNTLYSQSDYESPAGFTGGDLSFLLRQSVIRQYVCPSIRPTSAFHSFFFKRLGNNMNLLNSFKTSNNRSSLPSRSVLSLYFWEHLLFTFHLLFFHF